MSDALDDFMGGRADWPFPFNHGHMDRPSLSTEREHIRRERAKLDARERELVEAANRFGEEPPVGTVVTFQKHFPDSIKTYSYAAIRIGPERAVGGGWFLTGRDGKQPRTWAWLCDFIGDGPFRVIAPESAGGKSKFFNVLLDETTPSNLVLIVDETGRTTVATDPANPPVAWGALANLSRKTGIVAPIPDASDVDPLRPFEVVRVGEDWLVRDRRVTFEDGNDVVAKFADSKDGERRARQSAADRNRTCAREMLKLENEPPVGARVRSVTNRRCWARRESKGWIRYNGTTIQGVRLSWPEVRRQLGRIEAGSLNDTALFARQGEQ